MKALAFFLLSLTLGGIAFAQGHWSSRVTHDRVDDTTTTSFLLSSTDGTAYLHLQCTTDGHTIHRSFYIATNKILDERNMTVRINVEAPVTAMAYTSTDHRAAFFTEATPDSRKLGIDYYFEFAEFLPAVMHANRLLVRLPVFEEADHTWEFHPKGFNMTKLEQVCGITSNPPEK